MAMNIFLLRHGLAAERAEAGCENDSDRPLTAEGEKTARKITAGLRAMGVTLDALVSSPYARARRTAEIVAEEFGAEKVLDFSDDLACGGDLAQLVDHLRQEYRNANDIMLVGHEPDLSNLISMLVSGRPGLLLTLKKGGLCKLAVESLRFGRCGSMEWLLTPKQIIRAG
jgi:phosphohistidine phosphatase